MGLNRIYFSAYQQITPENPQMPDQQGFIREHRLYQVDFLFRKYGFEQSDIFYDKNNRLSIEQDPKEIWAKNHPEFFPVNINTANKYKLLRVPGLGPNTVEMIINKRNVAKISSIDDIGTVNKRTLKASKYLDFGSQPKNKAFLFNF
ncbi:MAG: Helix-hairpin-helix motif protein [Planctomycetes bacterium ADurb.Bin401]|nr:MAG: Helix-hairpin-helix motif protein [Planctomycetes bacterium ADurb.Bin401]